MWKWALILGAAYFIFVKPAAAPAVVAASPYASMTAEQIDAAIDEWIAQHPEQPLPDELKKKGIELGLII